MHNNKKHVETFEMHPVPDRSVHKNAVSSDQTNIIKDKGIDVDRYNHNFSIN